MIDLHDKHTQVQALGCAHSTKVGIFLLAFKMALAVLLAALTEMPHTHPLVIVS